MWLVVTHLCVFAAGYITCRLLALWEGRRVLADEGEPPVEIESKKSWSEYSVPPIVLILMSAAIVMLGLGVQQIQFQRDADARAEEAQRIDVCYETWGRDMITTLETRVTATGKVEKKEQVKDAALDAIILVVAALRADPPTAVEGDFDRTLVRFADAKAALEEQREKAETTRDENPYPVLNCRP